MKKKICDEEREKYVKINWKSIESDVKIKFIRAAREKAIAMGIYFCMGHITNVYMDLLFFVPFGILMIALNNFDVLMGNV